MEDNQGATQVLVQKASEQKHASPSQPKALLSEQPYLDQTQLVGAPTQLIENQGYQEDTQLLDEDALSEGDTQPIEDEELEEGNKTPAKNEELEEGESARAKGEEVEEKADPNEKRIGKHLDTEGKENKRTEGDAAGGWMERAPHNEKEAEHSRNESVDEELGLGEDAEQADTVVSGKENASLNQAPAGNDLQGQAKKSFGDKETPLKAPPAEAVGGWRTARKSREGEPPSKEGSKAALKSSQTVSETVDSDAPTESESDGERKNPGTKLVEHSPLVQLPAANEQARRLEDHLETNLEEEQRKELEKGTEEAVRHESYLAPHEDVIPDSDTEGPDGRELEFGTIPSVNAPSVKPLAQQDKNTANLPTPSTSLFSCNLGEGPMLGPHEQDRDCINETDRERQANTVTGLEDEPSQRDGNLAGPQEDLQPGNSLPSRQGRFPEEQRGPAEGVGQTNARESERKAATNGEMEDAVRKEGVEGAGLEETGSEALPLRKEEEPVTADNQPVNPPVTTAEELMPELRPDQREPPFTQIQEDAFPVTTYTRRGSLVPKAHRTWSNFSAEPGEETQREALGVVDAMLGLGDVDLSQEEGKSPDPKPLPAGTRTPGLASLNIPVVPPRTLSIFDFQGSQAFDLDAEELPTESLAKAPEKKTPKTAGRSMGPPELLPGKGSEFEEGTRDAEAGGWITKKGNAKRNQPKSEVIPVRSRKAVSSEHTKAEASDVVNKAQHSSGKPGELSKKKQEALAERTRLDAVLGDEGVNSAAAKVVAEEAPREEAANIDWTQAFAVPDTQEEANVRLRRETPQKHVPELSRGLFAASLFPSDEKAAERQEAEEPVEPSREAETQKGKVPRRPKPQKEKEAKRAGVGTRATRSARITDEEEENTKVAEHQRKRRKANGKLEEEAVVEREEPEKVPESEKVQETFEEKKDATKEAKTPITSTHRVKQTAKRRKSNRVTSAERAVVKRRLEGGLDDTEGLDEESEDDEERKRTGGASALVLDSQVPILPKYEKLRGSQRKGTQPKGKGPPLSNKQVGAKRPAAKRPKKKEEKRVKEDAEAAQAVGNLEHAKKDEVAPEREPEMGASGRKRGLEAGKEGREAKRAKSVRGRTVSSRFKEAAEPAKKEEKQGVETAEKAATQDKRKNSTVPLAGLIRTRRQRELGEASDLPLSQKAIASLRERGTLAATKEGKEADVRKAADKIEAHTGREDQSDPAGKGSDQEVLVENEPGDAPPAGNTGKAEGRQTRGGGASDDNHEVEFLEERRRSTAKERSAEVEAKAGTRNKEREGAAKSGNVPSGGAPGGASKGIDALALRKGKRSVAKRHGEETDEKRPTKRSKRAGLDKTPKASKVATIKAELESSKEATVKTEARGGKRTRETGPRDVRTSGSAAEEKSQHLRRGARRSGELSVRVSGVVSDNVEGLSTPNLRRKRDMGEVRVFFSNRVADQVKEAQKKILKRLGAHEAKDVPSCTHLVADSFGRTKNMLEAIVGAKKIVKPSWLDSCGQASYFEDEAPHMLNDELKEKEFKFSLKASLAAAEETRIFDGIKIYITPNTTPDRNFFRSILEMGGGELVTRCKQGDCLLVSSEEDRKVWEPLAAKGTPVYTTELLMAAVVQQNLDLSTNLLSDGKTKASKPDAKVKASREAKPQRKSRAWR